MKFVRVTDELVLQQVVARLEQRGEAGDEGDALGGQSGSVQEIVRAVRERGDAAVAEYTERFDGVALQPEAFEVPPDEVRQAIHEVDGAVFDALTHAHENIRAFHKQHVRASWKMTGPLGETMGQRVTPIASAGVYVPGGKAYYPSSVLMNIVPARVAGVQDIVMVSPPSWNGTIHPLVLAAAHISGATRVFRIGGAQAIAALAFGTRHIPRVHKITGPGNIFVTIAKRLVSDRCAIDKEAGPSEVLVVADDSADPRIVAAELVCQAEHEEDACAALVTPSERLAREVEAAIAKLLETLPRAGIARAALERHGTAYIVRGLDDAVAVANAYAPEHLSLQVIEPETLLDRITNAGAVMLGRDTPVAMGDYFAGPNHILPTGRRACFSSALGVDDFQKTTNFIQYNRRALERDADAVISLAQAEQLDAHARAVEVRR